MPLRTCFGSALCISWWPHWLPFYVLSVPLGRIGGAIPTVFSYFAEVLAREKRGEHLSWLCMFWMIGGIYASAMAWAIIPHYGKSLPLMGSCLVSLPLSSLSLSLLSLNCCFDNIIIFIIFLPFILGVFYIR